MGGSVIKIEGLQKTLARFDVKKYEPQIQTCFNDFGITVKVEATQFAPVYEGHLKPAIFQDPIRLGNIFGCSVDYAAYVEFGTRKYAAAWVAMLPADWQLFAAEHRGGKGGTFMELVARITEWVHKKGLGTGFSGNIGVTGTYSIKTRKRTGNALLQNSQDRQVAYLIARKIIRDGVPAQPFIYPAYNIARKQLLKDLNAIKL